MTGECNDLPQSSCEVFQLQFVMTLLTSFHPKNMIIIKVYLCDVCVYDNIFNLTHNGITVIPY